MNSDNVRPFPAIAAGERLGGSADVAALQSDAEVVPTHVRYLARTALFCCAMNMWQFNVGVRIFIFDILAGLFIVVALLPGSQTRSLAQRSILTRSGMFLWFRAGLVALSGMLVVFLNLSPNAVPQYAKGASSLLTYLLFSWTLIKVLTRVSAAERDRMFTWFVAGVVASCVFELLQIWLLKVYDIELDALVWNALSVNTPRESTEHFLTRYQWDYLYRGTGFPGGPNVQGAYIATIFPWIVLKLGRKYQNGLAFVLVLMIAGLALTMSRTGTVAVAVGVLAAVGIAGTRRVTVSKGLVVLLCLGMVGWQVFSEDIFHFVETREDVDIDRLAMYSNGLDTLAKYPMGVGLGNYVVVVPGPRVGWDPNPHSSWFGILVEEGALGVLWYAAFFVFLMRYLLRTRGFMQIALAGGVLGLAAGGAVNTLFDQPFALCFWSLCIAYAAEGSLSKSLASRTTDSVRPQLQWAAAQQS